MATSSKKTTPSPKAGQTPAERRRINSKLVKEVERLVKPLPLEVIGHIDSAATCCRNGTVALVKVDGSQVEKFEKANAKAKAKARG